MTIDSFAGEYHEMKAKGGGKNGIQRPLPFAGLGPLPQPLVQEDNRNVVYWLRDSLQHTQGAQEKGETDGNATSIAEKRSIGHPQKSTKDDDDDNIPVDSHKHRYLEREMALT